MKARTLVLSITMVTALSITVNPQVASNRASSSSFTIRADKVLKVAAGGDGPLYAVRYSFKFSDRSEVLVDGLGVVPAEGEYSYFLAKREILFRDADTGRIIVAVPLSDTGAFASATVPVPDWPAKKDFPDKMQEYTWKLDTLLFQPSLNSLLNVSFNYQPERDEYDTRLVRTDYAFLPLVGAPAGVRGRIALLISFPHKDGGTNYYGVQTLVQEGRTGSSKFKDPIEESVKSAGLQFVTAFADRLEQQARKMSAQR